MLALNVWMKAVLTPRDETPSITGIKTSFNFWKQPFWVQLNNHTMVLESRKKGMYIVTTHTDKKENIKYCIHKLDIEISRIYK